MQCAGVLRRLGRGTFGSCAASHPPRGVLSSRKLRAQIDAEREERKKYDKTFTRMAKTLQRVFHAKRHVAEALEQSEKRTAELRVEVEALQEVCSSG